MFVTEKHPELFTLERLKKNRGDKIYFDYLQHYQGKTLAAPYTPRARPGATVSTPLHWEEVDSNVAPTDFHLLNIEERLARHGDLIAALAPQPIEQVIRHLSAAKPGSFAAPLMDIFFLETAALNVMDITNRKEGIRIPIPDDGLQLGLFQTGDDHENHFLAVPGVGSFPFQIRDAASQALGEGIADVLVFLTDDPYGFGLVDPFVGDINHFKGDKVGDQRIHRVIPTEYEARARQDKEVDEHDDLPDRERRLFVDENRDDFAAVRGTPCPDDQADARTEDHPSEDSCQQRIERNGFNGFQQRGANRHHQDGCQRGEGKRLADLLVTQKQERNIENRKKNTERQMKKVGQHNGNAGNPAVNDVIVYEEYFQCNRDQSGSDQHDQDAHEHSGFRGRRLERLQILRQVWPIRGLRV
ncbi:hypothetical protein BGX30_004832 [Mortierella sp. GBA39]|nr:hypothetical protein BGX30_004832 [Mortierella sp. GBA39]